MNRTLAAAVAAGAFLGAAGLAHADDVAGGYCKVLETRVSNPHGGLIEKKLWEYTAPTLGDAPVMGWIDTTCADRGARRADLLDIGKRVWFSFSGPEGASADQGKVTVDSSTIRGDSGSIGLSVKDRTIYGVVTPRHDCIYVVSVWKDNCQGQ
jgi:hypothetical protein